MKPLYEHDCESCTYLGTSRSSEPWEDWYVCYCESSFGWRTLIARFGSDGPEYRSVPIAACAELTRMEKQARLMGFEFTDEELVKFGERYVKEKIWHSSQEFREICPGPSETNLLGDWTEQDD